MSLSSLNSIGQTVFELRVRKQKCGRTDKRAKNGEINTQNYTNFVRNLAMMVIYLPVKFDFDWINRFRVKSPETKMWTDVGHINLIGGLVTHNPPNNLLR